MRSWFPQLAGWWAMVRLTVRSHRAALLLWPVAIAILVGSSAASIAALYDTAQDRSGYAISVGQSTVSIALNGRGADLQTIGGITVNELGFYTLLVFPVIAMYLTVRLTRREEEAGREELVTSAPIGRMAPSLAALAVVWASLSVAMVLAAGTLIAAGLPATGAWVYTAALFLTLAMYSALAFVAAQLSQSTRTAHGLALAALGVIYVVRALVDGQGWAPQWAGPGGWIAHVAPFGARRVWPVVATAVVAGALVGVGIWIRSHRDLGAGLVAERPGAPRAGSSLMSARGLAWRLGRGAMAAWAGGAAAFGAMLGFLGPEMESLLDQNPEWADLLGPQGADPVVMLSSYGLVFLALIAASHAVSGVGHLSDEEESGRVGRLMSTGMSRVAWFGAAAVGAVAHGCVTLLVGGIAMAVVLALATGDAATLGQVTAASFGYVPAVVVIGATAVLGWAVSARGVAIGWVLVCWASVVGLLGTTLQLPEWAVDLSPLSHVGRPPLEGVPAVSLTALGVLALVITVAALKRFVARDIRAG